MTRVGFEPTPTNGAGPKPAVLDLSTILPIGALDEKLYLIFQLNF